MGGGNTEERDWGKREPQRIYFFLGGNKRKKGEGEGEGGGTGDGRRFHPRVPQQQRGCSNVTVAEELTRGGE